ncbi:hypothetical protein Pan216_41670 [Planctomycetes bacterium Pan216]|uniref:Uncharacterized protein n=1 Tax=Kolteria novifilia TaxID=2527975 RepID=A0A518B8I1_9BACT|nr:hypothetical protein Pan216_41670 [Planctomycetes bacterium Pan216]
MARRTASQTQTITFDGASDGVGRRDIAAVSHSKRMRKLTVGWCDIVVLPCEDSLEYALAITT